MAYQRIEVLTGTERRRNYTSAEKVRMVEEAFRPGVVVTEAARRLGVHESLLYRWRLRVPNKTGFWLLGGAWPLLSFPTPCGQ